MGELSSDFSNIDSSEFMTIIGPLVKAGSAALAVVNPWVSVLYALLGGAVAEINQHNTREILQNLKEKYDELDSKNLITKEYLTLDSYVNLMIDILNRVHSLNTIQKRKSVAEIYKSVLQNRLEYEDSDERLFVDALAKINVQEIIILNFMNQFESSLKTIDSWANFYNLYSKNNADFPLEKYRFRFFATQLEQMGMVFCSDLSGYDQNVAFLTYKESDEPNESSAGITPMGKRFLDYIEK